MNGFLLVADSGSTKTDWCLTDGNRTLPFSTQGLNPYQLSQNDLQLALRTSYEWEKWHIHTIRFYGAGCTAEKIPLVEEALRAIVSPEADIRVESDMLGAARALLGDSAGLVGILGTGSNSCLYDGHSIQANVSPLGYILGDEGSGAYIGRRLVGNCLKHQFRTSLCDTFAKETQLDASTVVQRVYRMPQPNRFLASLMPFCEAHRNDSEMHDFLLDCFSDFFRRNIALYQRPDLAVHLIGSIAYIYQSEIQEAASSLGFRVGRIQKAPLTDLVQYELCKLK